MSGKDEQRIFHLNETLDNCRGAFHRILYIRSLEQFIDQYEPLSSIIYFLNGALDALHLVKEKAFAFCNIVYDVDVGEQSIKQGKFHFLCGHTHTDVREKDRRANGFNKCAFSSHVCTGEKKKIVLRVHLNIIGHRLWQQ